MSKTYKPKGEILKFRIHKSQKIAYRRASSGHVSKWALPILDKAAGVTQGQG